MWLIGLMDDDILSTIYGSSITLIDETLAAFRQSCAGPILFPGDPQYDAARTIWCGTTQLTANGTRNRVCLQLGKLQKVKAC
jgi:hypothetical protein